MTGLCGTICCAYIWEFPKISDETETKKFVRKMTTNKLLAEVTTSQPQKRSRMIHARKGSLDEFATPSHRSQAVQESGKNWVNNGTLDTSHHRTYLQMLQPLKYLWNSELEPSSGTDMKCYFDSRRNSIHLPWLRFPIRLFLLPNCCFQDKKYYTYL